MKPFWSIDSNRPDRNFQRDGRLDDCGIKGDQRCPSHSAGPRPQPWGLWRGWDNSWILIGSKICWSPKTKVCGRLCPLKNHNSVGSLQKELQSVVGVEEQDTFHVAGGLWVLNGTGLPVLASFVYAGLWHLWQQWAKELGRVVNLTQPSTTISCHFHWQ